ncbi:hypothetical protein HHA01_05330 [Halomonas halmophila]|uniref:Uncharacterized protein n=1 Tax=Halomonas halmophila TaxID=252 RepID=A0A4Y4EWR7_9GAMM|nr:hypothetical protein HHA01_05330 [Halomonas halmophila]
MKFTHTGDGETLSWLHAYLQSVRDNCNINMVCPDAKKVGEETGGGYEYYPQGGGVGKHGDFFILFLWAVCSDIEQWCKCRWDDS